MDRSFLSQPEVIQASRRFVCIRLATYESETESKFSSLLFRTRSGDVENTTFAILAPDGKTQLTRTGRTAKNVFKDSAEMSKTMHEIAGKYPGEKPDKGSTPALPVTLDVRIGINVASSDCQPLVIVSVTDEKNRAKLTEKVAKLAWSQEFIGRFVYSVSTKASDLKNVENVKNAEGLILVEPDNFGQSGRVVQQLSAEATPQEIATAMQAVLAKHKSVEKNMRDHRLNGITAGAFWVPNLPVTDRQEESARTATKRAIEQRKE